jgi:pimeloyl-ACP methyl ester carboxylesterase
MMKSAELTWPQKSTNVRSFEDTLRTGFRILSPVSPSLAAVVAERLFFRAVRYPAPTREKAILQTGHRLSFRAELEGGPVELACWSWGDGPTVFLLHGWSGRAGQLGAFVEPLVSAGYSVLAFDAPAHGESGGKQASALIFARALSQVVARFGPAHAVVAHSMGGWAATYALLGGAPIERVALIGSPTDPSAFTRQFAERLGLSAPVVERMWKRAEARLGVPRASFELAPRISQVPVSVPALIIHDRGDAEVPFANAGRWASSWPGARLVETEGLGHHRILRDPAVVERVLELVKA